MKYCLDAARLEKIQVTKPWLNSLDNWEQNLNYFKDNYLL